MYHGYWTLIQELQKNWQKFGPYLSLSGLQFSSVYQTLPTSCYDSLWMPLVQSNGFYAALPMISAALSTFLMRNNQISPAQIHRQYEYIASSICGPILLYKTHNCTTQQIINRAKELKKIWKLLPNICSHLIPMLEGVEQKQNEPQSKRQKIINDLLMLFETNDSKLDYKNYGFHLLNQAAGEIVYDISQQDYSYKELYQKLCLSNKDKIITFFSKIKRKQQICASILSQIVRPQNNIKSSDKVRNVILFFIFIESWDRFKQNQSRLKEQLVIQTVAQAFHRLLFLAFDNQQPVTSLILHFLLESKFTLYQQLKFAASPHLLALFKLYSYAQNDKISRLIEDIWKQKMKGTRFIELQLTQYPLFVGRTGVQQKLQEATTRSISSRSTLSDHFSLKSSLASKNRKRRTTRSTSLNKQITQIEEHLRKCNFEKIYLLLDEFKKFYFSQYSQKGPDDISRQNVLNIVVLVIKRLESTSHFRYNCEYLNKCIVLELAQLIQRCCQSQFTSSQHGEKLNLLQCCYSQKGQITLQSLIKFHIKNNYQEGLDTFFKLKLIEQDLNSNNLSGARLQSFQQQLDLLSFEGRIYSLYKSEFNQTKRMDSKKLIIICKLILLKSKNVANNLLANYAYLMLKQERANETLYKKRIENFTQFMNEHLQIATNSDRSQIFLKLGEILDEFQFQSSESSLRVIDSMIGNKYFDVLRRKQHYNYYLVYFQKYLQMNYLKQALYFLQLYHFQQKQPSIQHAIVAINIYSRLNPSFKLHLSQIIKKQQSKFPLITQSYYEASQQQNRCSIQQLILSAINQLESVQILFTNNYEYYRGQKPMNFLWTGYYYPFLSKLLNQLTSQQQGQQIDQSLKRCAILLLYLQMQVNSIINPMNEPNHGKFGQIINLINKLGSQSQKNQLYSLFLKLFKKGVQSEQLQRLYIQGLIKNKESQQVIQYLRKNLKQEQPFTKMATRYLCLLAKYHFQQVQFAKCLSIIKQIQDRKQKIDNPTEIYHMELECRQSIILNYTLEQHLKLLNKCVLSSSKDLTPLNRDRHFQYYFKIFRNVFNRYHFDSIDQNEVFLETYFNFLEANSILRENIQYLSEAVFYLLRFLMQKFNLAESGQGKTLQKLILQKLKGNLKVLIPYCSYLLRKISSTIQKNILIKGLIKAVASQNPKECTWTLAFLRNFSLRTQKLRSSEQQVSQIDGISDIYQQTIQALRLRKAQNKDHCIWIDSLIRLSFLESEDKRKKCAQFKQISVPQGLLFMFDFDFNIRSVEDARVLSNGKSAPIQLTFRLIHVRDGYLKTVRAIIKSNVGTKNYRLQSNTANFFQEAGVIDSDTTYKILHLSKYLVVIEHRANCGTLTNVIFENLPEVKRLQGSIMIQMQKKKQIQKRQRRLLEVFDSINKPQFHIKFSQVIYFKARNIKDWWKKYCNFIRTSAQWSYMGYIIGLGDRHCDNILITEDVKLIHIDFQYVLDTGLALTFPEWVPFRLTSCLYQPLGILGVYGAFYGQMLQAAKNFQSREQKVWKALSNLIGSMNTNIGQQILNRARFLPHYKSSDEGIAKIIQFSKDPELLRLMFQGWRPYL